MIVGANVATIILMLLVGYSDRLDPTVHPVLSCLGLIFPVFVVLNLCFLIFWALFSLKRTIVPIAGFLLAYSPVRTYFPLNLGTEEKPNLKIISYNVAGYSADENGKRGGGLQGALDYVANCDADVACLQEVTLREKDMDRVGNRFPHVSSQYLRYSGSGVTLLSKYPIRKKELIEFEEGCSQSVAFYVDVNGTEVIFVNNHLESAQLSLKERSNFENMVHGAAKGEVSREESQRLLVKLGARNAKRARQVKALSRFLKAHKGVPVILCGDFNDSPISYPHYEMSKRLTDCFRESGNGLGWTFFRNAIHVRIDHIFCSSHFVPCMCKVDANATSSDHYPMLCSLKMQGKTQK